MEEAADMIFGPAIIEETETISFSFGGDSRRPFGRRRARRFHPATAGGTAISVELTAGEEEEDYPSSF